MKQILYMNDNYFSANLCTCECLIQYICIIMFRIKSVIIC